MTTRQQQLQQAAQQLADTRLRATPIDALPICVQPETLDEAYYCQSHLHRLLEQAGAGAVTGHKIGCTTRIMQQYLRIDSPCAGRMLDSSVHSSDASYQRSALCQPGVECEIAVCLSDALQFAQLDPEDTGQNRQHAASAISHCMASIELVDSRWLDFTTVAAPALIADDFFSAGCVLGEERQLDPLGLDKLNGRMMVNGVVTGEGSGVDILGHPLDALVWLARLRQSQGQCLQAGEIVTLGSVVKTQWIEQGDEVLIEFEGLGTAALQLI